MSQAERMFEINRRLAEIITYLNNLDELEKRERSDPEKTAGVIQAELKEVYKLRPELEAERDELEKELALLLK